MNSSHALPGPVRAPDGAPAAGAGASADTHPERELSASPPMFRSRWLDALSRVHPITPVVIFGPVIALCAVLSVRNVGVAATLGLLVGGYALWTLVEYWMHRIIFHFEPEAGIGARLHWIMHGVHHDHPSDPLRLVMPPSVSLPLAALFFGIFELTLGPDLALGASAGFFSGYLAYDMIHYYVHHARPRNRVTKTLRERHMRHHFQDDTRGFGVSAPYWDNVFGTAPRRSRARARPLNPDRG